MIIEESFLLNNTKNTKTTKMTTLSEEHDYNTYFRDNYEDVSLLATGGFSKVYSLKDKKTGEVLVMKISKTMTKALKQDNNENDNDQSNTGLPKDILRELSVMKQLDGEYIVKSIKNYYYPE